VPAGVAKQRRFERKSRVVLPGGSVALASATVPIAVVWAAAGGVLVSLKERMKKNDSGVGVRWCSALSASSKAPVALLAPVELFASEKERPNWAGLVVFFVDPVFIELGEPSAVGRLLSWPALVCSTQA